MSENAVTHSIALADLSLEELVQISQGIGHQIERLREQRAYLRRKIDAGVDTLLQRLVLRQFAQKIAQLHIHLGHVEQVGSGFAGVLGHDALCLAL